MKSWVPLSFFLASSLSVAALSVVNHSFEDLTGESPSNEFTFGPLLGWDLYEEKLILKETIQDSLRPIT